MRAVAAENAYTSGGRSGAGVPATCGTIQSPCLNMS